jgi:adenylate cyclase
VAHLRRHLELITGAAVVLVVLALGAVHALRSLDLSSIDARFSIRGTQRPNDVVLVGIDQRAFNQLENEPFPLPRKLDATVIRHLALAGAKVIAVDLEFNHPTDPTDDNALINAVRATPRVVISTAFVGPNGTTPIFGGGKALAYSRSTPGDAQFPLDPDGAIRRMSPQILGLTTVPLAAAQLATGHRIDFPGGSDGTIPIDFAGADGSVPEISFADVLSGHFASGAVRGKVAVIGQTGATDQGQQDIHATATDSAMSGPEVEANAIETVLRGFRSAPRRAG